MKLSRVYQTPGDGQCFRCCLATLLQVPLDTVPPMKRTKDGWMARLRSWTRTYGYDLIYVRNLAARFTKAPVIVGGNPTGQRGAWHAIIVQSGRTLHDPFPPGHGRSRGLKTWVDYYLLVPMEPGQYVATGAAVAGKQEE